MIRSSVCIKISAAHVQQESSNSRIRKAHKFLLLLVLSKHHHYCCTLAVDINKCVQRFTHIPFAGGSTWSHLYPPAPHEFLRPSARLPEVMGLQKLWSLSAVIYTAFHFQYKWASKSKKKREGGMIWKPKHPAYHATWNPKTYKKD